MTGVKKPRRPYLGSYQAKVPKAAADYFNRYYAGGGVLFREHPTIDATFVPGRGWRPYPGVKRVSRTWVRKLAAEGVTHIALRSYGRVADFSVRELSRR
jgi:hypothetical protein